MKPYRQLGSEPQEAEVNPVVVPRRSRRHRDSMKGPLELAEVLRAGQQQESPIQLVHDVSGGQHEGLIA